MRHQIRLAVLNGEASNLRELLLTRTQVVQITEIYDLNLMTSERLAELWDISIQNASMKLRRFYIGGYLDRSEHSAVSGGIEFLYSIPKWRANNV